MICSIVANRDKFLDRLQSVIAANPNIPDITEFANDNSGPFPRRRYAVASLRVSIHLTNSVWVFMLAHPMTAPTGHCRISHHCGADSSFFNVILSDAVNSDLAGYDLFDYLERKLNQAGVTNPEEQRIQLDLMDAETKIRRSESGLQEYTVTPLQLRELVRVTVIAHLGDVLVLRSVVGPTVNYYMVIQHPRSRALTWALTQIRNGYGRQVISAIETHSMTGVERVEQLAVAPGSAYAIVADRAHPSLGFGTIWELLGRTSTHVTLRYQRDGKCGPKQFDDGPFAFVVDHG